MQRKTYIVLIPGSKIRKSNYIKTLETLFTHKTMMRTALAVCLAGAFAVSCSNDDNTTGTGGPAPADITANYSNKLAYGDCANLALTYSGDSLIGKDVTLKTDDSKTAELTLNNILPHENATPIKDVSLRLTAEAIILSKSLPPAR